MKGKKRSYPFFSLTLEKGATYLVSYYNKIFEVRFIQVTPKGFNFLVDDENRCLLPSHLYKIKMDKRPKFNVWQCGLSPHVRRIK